MPTENRSSNTEMAAQLSPCPHCGQQDAFVEQLDSDASVVICQGRIDEHSACLARGPVGVQQHECEDQPGHDQAVKEWNKRAAVAPHPDPIAWIVGTAFWWTKEEAERDAAETGLSVVPVGPMVDTAEVERLESRIKTQRESIRSHVQEVDRLRVLEIKYGLKIEERNDLLRKCLEWITSARDGVLYPIARDFEGVVGRNAEGLGQTTPALIDAIGDALSASAEPSAPNDCAICRDLGNQCMECEEGEFREWADRHFAAADYRKTDAGVFIQDWMRHAYGAWCARGALTSKQ